MAGGQDHPPLLADDQEKKQDQASDECQADPDDGPGVVAGTCGGKAGWGASHSALASGPEVWWPSRGPAAASLAVSQPRAGAQAAPSSAPPSPLQVSPSISCFATWCHHFLGLCNLGRVTRLL